MPADRNAKTNIGIEVDELRKLIRITITGCLCDADLLKMDARCRAVPEIRQGFDVLCECLDLQDVDLTWKGVYDLSLLTHNDSNRVAIVTANPVVFGMASTYAICANWKDPRVSVFLDVHTAISWLENG
jgi:hypothetical protein